MTNTEKEAIADRCYCLFCFFVISYFLSYHTLLAHCSGLLFELLNF